MPTYFDRFFREKDLPVKSWDLVDSQGVMHFISSEVVIEAIKDAPPIEQAAICATLTKIDFLNGDVMDYLHHLAKGLVENWAKEAESAAV